MKKIEYIKWLGWVLLFLVIFFRGCKNSDNEKTSTTKEVKGTFAPVKPTHNPFLEKSNIEKTKKRPETTSFYIDKLVEKYYKDLENKHFEKTKENDSLRQKFANLSDSLKIKEYEKAIVLNKFRQDYNNEDLAASFYGIVQGQIKEVNFSYETKKKPIPTTKFRLLAGVGISNTIQLDKPLFNANLSFQNQKGNILEIGFDSEKRLNIGYKQSIFKITK